jgi:hypothetical protein
MDANNYPTKLITIQDSLHTDFGTVLRLVYKVFGEYHDVETRRYVSI